MRRFVIVVDTQVDFMAADGALSVPGADALVAPIADWLGALDPTGTAGVLFTFDTHRRELYAGSAEAAQFPPHCLRDTPGWANLFDAAQVDPAIPVWRLEKGVFAMWAEPGLRVEDMRRPDRPAHDRDAFFARLAGQEDVRDATVIGVAADYCVRYAIEGLVARGFAVTVPAALTRGIDRGIAAVADDFPPGTVTVA